MNQCNMAVVGLGATGSVLAAALLGKYPDTICVGRNPDAGERLAGQGLRVSGVIQLQAPVRNYISQIRELKAYRACA